MRSLASAPGDLALRDAHSATALADGRVLVTGGFPAEGDAPLAGAEVYDPDTGRWTTVGRMRTARGGHAAALLGEVRVLVAGGWTGDRAGRRQRAPDRRRVPARPSDPARSGAAVLPDGRVVVAGGGSGVEVIDPHTGRSRVLSEAGRGRASFSTVGLSHGTLRVIGGYDEAIQLTGTDLAIPLDQL